MCLQGENKVKAPGDGVNVLCQQLHRSPLDIIDIERPTACQTTKQKSGRASDTIQDVKTEKLYQLEKERERQAERVWNHPL